MSLKTKIQLITCMLSFLKSFIIQHKNFKALQISLAFCVIIHSRCGLFQTGREFFPFTLIKTIENKVLNSCQEGKTLFYLFSAYVVSRLFGVCIPTHFFSARFSFRPFYSDPSSQGMRKRFEDWILFWFCWNWIDIGNVFYAIFYTCLRMIYWLSKTGPAGSTYAEG